MAIKYPQSFIDKAKRLFPNDTNLHHLLETGSFFVQNKLNDYRYNCKAIPIARVLSATSLEELQSFARDEQERYKLYDEWLDIFDKYQKGRNAEQLKNIEDAHARGERLT